VVTVKGSVHTYNFIKINIMVPTYIYRTNRWSKNVF